jgi:hypothetical protein
MTTINYMSDDLQSRFNRSERGRKLWRAVAIGAVVAFALYLAFACALLAGWIKV